MHSEYAKAGLMGAWVAAVATLGYIAGLTSFPVLVSLAVLSLAPAAVMVWLSSPTAPSMSESIREALR